MNAIECSPVPCNKSCPMVHLHLDFELFIQQMIFFFFKSRPRSVLEGGGTLQDLISCSFSRVTRINPKLENVVESVYRRAAFWSIRTTRLPSLST